MASKRKLADAGGHHGVLLRGKAPRLRMDGAAPGARAATSATSRFGFGFRGPSITKPTDGEAGNQVEETTPAEQEARVDGPLSNGSSGLKLRRGSATLARSAVPPPGTSGLPTRTFASVRKPSITGTLGTGQHAGSGKENNDPSFVREVDAMAVASEAAAACTQVHEAFASHFGREKIDKIQELLRFRSKVTNKFDVKGVKNEQATYIRDLKEALKGIAAEIRQFEVISASLDHSIYTERLTLQRRLAKLDDTARENDQLTLELDRMQVQIREIQSNNERLQKSEADALSSKAKLQETLDDVQTQLQMAQKQNAQLELELKAHEARMSDRTQYFEEKKKELEHFYQKKDLEEEKRKNLELESLQEKLSRAREEIATAIQERDSYKDRASTMDAELKTERERRTKLEMEKCTLEAQNTSLEIRLSGGSSETAELKEKLKKRDEELSDLVRSMTEIQKFTASASSKVEMEKKELSDKIDTLQQTLRELERKDTISESSIKDLQKQLLTAVTAKNELERSAEQLRTQLKDAETQLQEWSRKTSVEAGVRQMLEDQMREMRTEHVAVNAQMEAVKAEMKRLQLTNDDTKAIGAQRLAALEEQHKADRAKLHAKIERLEEERVSLQSEVSTLRERASTARDSDVQELCAVKREADVLRLRLKELSNQGIQSMAEKDKEIEELQEKLRQGDKLRRMMHNTIQELRGNVRVFARARPFLPSDRCDPNTTTPVISCDYDGQSIKLRRPGKSNSSDVDTYSFSFDKVFPPSAGQDAVFEEVSEFVQSALDGYHVCLFSYGQTGSGKTHTMQGSGNGQMRGIIPRAIEKVLGECEHLKEQGWNYTTQVSFLEIYNETLKDLLVSKADTATEKKLAIKKDARGSVHVPDLTMVDVTSIDQVEMLMERASRARSVASTDMNAQSSRSHSVFTLHVQGVNESQGIVLDGKLNLVDLAGSERASRSNVSGDRLKETQAINKSLSCLADVFSAIGNKSAHIPFRNSKLTYLLQSSLSGDGKTLMMVNLSPTLESSSESLCSLRFAQHVNQCELGKPKRQIKSKQDATG